MSSYRAALDALAAAHWTVRERSPDRVLSHADVWPDELRRRYPAIPAALTEFVSRVETCMKPDETAWFLTAADYAGTSGFAFAWNEWERMELESYTQSGDEPGAARVREFWNAYLPFYLDVGGDYAYFAVRVTEPKPVSRSWWRFGPERRFPEPRLGSVVHAAEEFRAPSEVAGSFDEFLASVASAVSGRDGGPLDGLLL